MKRPKPTRDVSSLPPPTEFLALEEIAARWRRKILTTSRLLAKYKVPVCRISSKAHLYRLADIEAIEEAAMHKPKTVVSTVFQPGKVANPSGKNK